MNKEKKIYKILLKVINAMLFVGTIAGVFCMFANMVNYKEYLEFLGSNTSWNIAIVVVGIAILMIIISVLGFLADHGKNTLLLEIYVCSVIAVLLLFLIVSGIIAYTYRDTLERIENNMLYNIEVYRPGTRNFETIVWDDIQQSFECCGVNGHQDWARYHDSYRSSSTIKKYPDSCSSEDKEIHYVDGCLKKLSENIRLKTAIGGAIAGIFLYLLLAFYIACMVWKHMNKYEALILTTTHEKGQANYGIQAGLNKNGYLEIHSQKIYPSLQSDNILRCYDSKKLFLEQA